MIIYWDSVITIYLLVNLAFLHVLSIGGMAGEPFVAGAAAKAIRTSPGEPRLTPANPASRRDSEMLRGAAAAEAGPRPELPPAEAIGGRPSAPRLPSMGNEKT